MRKTNAEIHCRYFDEWSYVNFVDAFNSQKGSLVLIFWKINVVYTNKEWIETCFVFYKAFTANSCSDAIVLKNIKKAFNSNMEIDCLLQESILHVFCL